MERLQLLTVEDTFWIEGNAVPMLIIHPNFSVPRGGWQSRTETVVVMRPDGQMIDATAVISMTHFNIPEPSVPIDKRWRVCMRLTNRTKEEVPIGSRILVSQELRDALLPPSTRRRSP